MFKHIVVPLDGSFRAEQALPVAARIAHASGCPNPRSRACSPGSEALPVNDRRKLC